MICFPQLLNVPDLSMLRNIYSNVADSEFPCFRPLFMWKHSVSPICVLICMEVFRNVMPTSRTSFGFTFKCVSAFMSLFLLIVPKARCKSINNIFMVMLYLLAFPIICLIICITSTADLHFTIPHS